MKAIGWLMMVMMVLVAGVAFAAGDIAGAQGGVDSFVTGTVQPVLQSVMFAAVTAVMTYLAALAKRKWGLDISNATQERISSVAYEAVMSVEERAARYAKEKGEQWASESKHAEAINYILSKVPSLTREEADAKVTAALAMIPGLGATRVIGA